MTPSSPRADRIRKSFQCGDSPPQSKVTLRLAAPANNARLMECGGPPPLWNTALIANPSLSGFPTKAIEFLNSAPPDGLD